MPALSEGPMCKQALSSAIRAPAGDKCQKLVTVAVNTKSRMVQLGNLPRHFWSIQITGKVQLPSLAGNSFCLRAAVEAESTCELCSGPTVSHSRRGCWVCPVSNILCWLQIAPARTHTFTWNKEYEEGDRKFQREPNSRSCKRTLSTTCNGLGWNKRWGSTGKNILFKY